MDEKEAILEGLKPLFEKAEAEGLFFYNAYRDLWFSPKALKFEHSSGRFVWGAANWQLRDPKERLQQLYAKRASAEGEIRDFQLMMMD
ncbi:hypothetical protein D478_14840 [Brevibacillus agri BAB-2500]|nr:hypothetical protein D478_14840 [Brevibacillus agri BAB-2500]